MTLAIPSNNSVDHHDVTLMSGAALNESTLPQVVAAGRLYILNGAGEFEQVLSAFYERGGSYLATCSDGYEFDEDGNTTRVFQVQS